MSIYLIDFENVTSEGLSGIAKLQQEDKVVLFYSANAHKISLSVHRAICNTKASLEYFEVAVGGKNALDHQLSTYLGYLIGNNQDTQYFIVSKDRGYEYLSEFWKKMFIDESKKIDVKRVTSIKIATPEAVVIDEEVSEQTKELEATKQATEETQAKETYLPGNSEEPKQNAVEFMSEETKIPKSTKETIEETKVKVEEVKVQEAEVISAKVNDIEPNWTNKENKVSTSISKQAIETKVVSTENTSREVTTLKQSKVVDIKRGNQKPKSNVGKPKNTNKLTQKINPNEMTLVEQNAVVEKQIREILGNDLNEEQLRRVVQSFKQSKNKQELHIKMIGAIGREKAPTMYNKIKGIMTKMEKATLAEKEIREIISQELQEEQVRKVVQSFKQSTTKQELHLKIIGVLGREQGPTIYNKIKNFMSKIS